MAIEHGLAALARTMAATPSGTIPTFEWATVVAGTGEVHVVLDSDPTGTPRPVSDNAAGPVAVGQRVHVAHHGLTLTLLSAPTVSTDVDWTPLTLDAGFSGGAWWCIRGGTVFLHGRVVRDAGDWTTTLQQFCTVPAAALIDKPTDTTYADHLPAAGGGGQLLMLAVNAAGALSARAAAAGTTNWLELGGVSWPAKPQ